MAAALDLKSSGETRAGSNPASGTCQCESPYFTRCLQRVLLCCVLIKGAHGF